MSIPRLKLLLLILFIALALPSAILVYQAYAQLKWEVFYQHQQLARELTLRIQAQFAELMQREENRSFADYEFLNVAGGDGSTFLQRSPLSEFPLKSDIPGLIGYFQVDAQGQLETPILPKTNASSYGISSSELRQREDKAISLRDILSQNRLVKKADASEELPAALLQPQKIGMLEQEERVIVAESPASFMSAPAESMELSVQGQMAFDQLKNRKRKDSLKLESSSLVGRVEDLDLAENYQIAARPLRKKSLDNERVRTEKTLRRQIAILPESLPASGFGNELDALTLSDDVIAESRLPGGGQTGVRIRTFESEVGPFELSLLDSGHFVLFRSVWRNQERYVQGLLLDPERFIDPLVEPAFHQSALSSTSDLVVAYQGSILTLYGSSANTDSTEVSNRGNELLYQTRLLDPFSDIELIFSLARLQVGAGAQVIVWIALILALVLVGGFISLYRLGARQIALGRQQQDFVSAVSHELKTPLTSIRMYAEMLREGWADEARKQTYYDFIFNESERLSRLINNVLQLARLSRNEQGPTREFISLDALVKELLPKLQSQLDQAGFTLELDIGESVNTLKLNLDPDWMTQIIINLVDNAIKFSNDAKIKTVQFRVQLLQQRWVRFSIRDFGPGIAKDQMKKIFRLFYRSENELTRETVGTGIGLALVHQLTVGMDGEVDVVNCEPGAEFRIKFRVV
ncbi:MAG: HAMP domain-containing histidine kinase [Proteobacteria bacterium]|nr:HAMP domain-containing histidine kinase [Pseudomonadota bacterium]